MIDRLRRALAQPVDGAWLAGFRVLFGVTMCASMLRFIGYGWIDGFFVRPRFHFTYWVFSWIEPLPGPLMHALFWLLAAAALCIALGLYFRVAAWAFVVGFTYLQLIDVTTYLNHYYLASLLGGLLALSPAHRLASLDTWREPGLRRDQVPRLWLWLLRFQVGVVYTYAGLAKAHQDWLIDAQPLRVWLAARSDLPLIGPLFTLDWAPHAFSWAGFLFDSLVVWFLLWRRSRPFAFLAVVVFHVLTRVLFPIGMFPVIMILAALVFFSPSWPRVLLGRVRPRKPDPARQPRPVAERASMRTPRALSTFAVAAALGYCLVQLVWPLRCFAYGGDVRWHEQGMRFSWRVMVREKNGSVTFHVRQKRTGRVWQVSPHRYLTRLQEREMATQPDLILQFAHFLRDDFERRGLGPVAVTVDAQASLNGRRMKPLIDPQVDLAQLEDGLWPASYILPAPTERPPQIRPI
jgi:vitamin K-dependent gamma-carboxylase